MESQFDCFVFLEIMYIINNGSNVESQFDCFVFLKIMYIINNGSNVESQFDYLDIVTLGMWPIQYGMWIWYMYYFINYKTGIRIGFRIKVKILN